MFKNDALFEKLETVSAVPELPSCVEPTLIAVEIQAGAPIEPVKPSLPEAMIVAMFAERKLSIAAFRADCAASQFAVY